MAAFYTAQVRYLYGLEFGLFYGIRFVTENGPSISFARSAGDQNCEAQITAGGLEPGRNANVSLPTCFTLDIFRMVW